jgi:hypothetical protein
MNFREIDSTICIFETLLTDWIGRVSRLLHLRSNVERSGNRWRWRAGVSSADKQNGRVNWAPATSASSKADAVCYAVMSQSLVGSVCQPMCVCKGCTGIVWLDNWKHLDLVIRRDRHPPPPQGTGGWVGDTPTRSKRGGFLEISGPLFDRSLLLLLGDDWVLSDPSTANSCLNLSYFGYYSGYRIWENSISLANYWIISCLVLNES